MTAHILKPRLMYILISALTISSFISCFGNSQKEPVNNNKEVKSAPQKYYGVTIIVDISNKNWLSILLADDGTINRKGQVTFDPNDKNFFMGITSSKPFDSLMNEMPAGLTGYCNTPSPACDTLKPICKAKIAFGNNTSGCEIDYCVNGTFNDLPKPIRDFIERSISVTEPWYQQQQKLLQKK